MVKVIDIDIVSGTQGVEERRGLAAENSDHPLCIEQVENGITEFRAGAFKVAEFVDDGESGGRVDRPFYGSKTAAEKTLDGKFRSARFLRSDCQSAQRDPV